MRSGLRHKDYGPIRRKQGAVALAGNAPRPPRGFEVTAERGMPVEIPDALIQALRRARRAAALTGAGISVESGIPTFRDAQSGLWARYDPAELATPEAFCRNPRLVWEWYDSRRSAVAAALPNPGHFALAELERRIPEFTIITQNVDGLHRRAGNTRIHELHGNIQRTKCFEEGLEVLEWEKTGEVPPRCPRCGGRLRPDVVWFGEMLPEDAMNASIRAAEKCDLLLVVGTSSLVYPAASLPYHAMARGAAVAEVNPVETPLTPRVSWFIAGKAGEALPALVRAAWPA